MTYRLAAGRWSTDGLLEVCVLNGAAKPVHTGQLRPWHVESAESYIRELESKLPDLVAASTVTGLTEALAAVLVRQGCAGDAWPEPEALPSYSPPPFPTAALPVGIREYVEDVSGFLQVPPALVASLVLSTLALACSRLAVVSPWPGYTEVLSLWSCTVLPSGSRKSGAFKMATKPIHDWQAARAEALRPEIAKAAAHADVLAKKLQHAQRRASEDDAGAENDVADLAEELVLHEVPRLPRLTTADATAEAIPRLLADQREVAGVFSGEGELLDTALGMYSKSGITNLGPLCSALDGECTSISRSGRDPIDLQCPRLSMALTTQPTVWNNVRENPRLRDKGFAPRFLVAVPASLKGTRTTTAKEAPIAIQEAYSRLVRGLLDLDAPEHNDLAVLAMTDDARAAFEDYADTIERSLDLAGDLEGLGEWGSKHAGRVARIAGVFHVSQHQCANLNSPIAASTIKSAITIGKFYEQHAKIAFFGDGLKPVVHEARRVLAAIQRRGEQVVSRRDLHRENLKNSNTFKELESLDAPLDLLIEHGYLIKLPKPEHFKGRPPGPTFLVHASALDPNKRLRNPQKSEQLADAEVTP